MCVNEAENVRAWDVASLEKSHSDTSIKWMLPSIFSFQEFDRNAGRLAIVVGTPTGAVKEQSAKLYATKMATEISS